MAPSAGGFDGSLLADAALEFVVIADTHYMPDPGGAPLEFESRRRQTARADAALRLAAALTPEIVVHVGDLTQTYPESADHARACAEARDQIRSAGIEPYVVVGNHDVGDKPDPTMPTAPVDAGFLDAYHREHGRTWYSFDRGDCHFVVINSQILNQASPHADAQRTWVERDLAAAAGRRLFLFLHLPPFLYSANEPHLGHYDNVGSPAREWLLNLVQGSRIEAVFAAHVHWAFRNRIGAAAAYTVPSTSFTRPGFSHLFTAGPPPERGRDDVDKLGFYLCRVREHRTDVHLVRTSGIADVSPSGGNGPRRLITRTSATLPHSPLGVTLLHPLAAVVQVPVAYPSVIRQTMRNDYPLLACVELGVRCVRVPASDLDDALQAERLELLRSERVRILAAHLRRAAGSLAEQADRHAGHVDGWELQLPGGTLPTAEVLQEAAEVRDGFGLPVSLCPVVSGEHLDPVKQHPRTRIGYLPEELPDLDGHLERCDLRLDRVLCRLQPGRVWRSVDALCEMAPLSRIGGLDLRIELLPDAGPDAAAIAAEALLAAARLPDVALYLEPLVDLDRTLDTSPGLLDTMCNPRDAFHVLRCLNTVLFASPPPIDRLQSASLRTDELTCFWLHAPDRSLGLFTSVSGAGALPEEALSGAPAGSACRCYDLIGGTLRSGTVESVGNWIRSGDLRAPFLLDIPHS